MRESTARTAKMKKTTLAPSNEKLKSKSEAKEGSDQCDHEENGGEP